MNKVIRTLFWVDEYHVKIEKAIVCRLTVLEKLIWTGELINFAFFPRSNSKLKTNWFPHPSSVIFTEVKLACALDFKLPWRRVQVLLNKKFFSIRS